MMTRQLARLLTVLLLFANVCWAQVPEVSEKTKPNLNQQLRYTDRRVDDLENTRASTAYVDAFFNTTTGHDHDGTDSKKVLATNLDVTNLTNGYFLKVSASSIAAVPLTSGSDLYSFSAYISSDQTLNNGDATVTFDTEDFDTGGNFSTSTYTFTAPVTGKYLFTCSLEINLNAVNKVEHKLQLYKNGSLFATVGGLYSDAAIINDQAGEGGSLIMSLSASDTVKVNINLAGTVVGGVTVKSGNASSRFTGTYLGL